MLLISKLVRSSSSVLVIASLVVSGLPVKAQQNPYPTVPPAPNPWAKPLPEYNQECAAAAEQWNTQFHQMNEAYFEKDFADAVKKYKAAFGEEAATEIAVEMLKIFTSSYSLYGRKIVAAVKERFFGTHYSAKTTAKERWAKSIFGVVSAAATSRTEDLFEEYVDALATYYWLEYDRLHEYWRIYDMCQLPNPDRIPEPIPAPIHRFSPPESTPAPAPAPAPI